MFNRSSSGWHHSNQFSAEAACEHCGGVIRHEPWCITASANVFYAFQIVADPGKLKLEDRLILHSLGVTWEPEARHIGYRITKVKEGKA